MASIRSKAAVLADDATGALEAGALLAGTGRPSVVHFPPPPSQIECADGAPVPVLDTETRHVPPEEAYRTLQAASAFLHYIGITWVYKKTDSTLRGSIGSEFSALLDVFDSRPLVYVPAYPKTGRTVRNGDLLVHGVPVADTEFAADTRNPIHHSAVHKVLASGCDAPLISVSSAGNLKNKLRSSSREVLICDAESEDDLAAIASVLREWGRLNLAAGPAGFLPYWADLLDLPRRAAPPLPHADRFLLVSGSLHPRSTAQVQHAIASGVEAIISPAALDPDPEGIALSLAYQAGERLRSGGFDAVIVFGGDTLAAVCREMEWSTLAPVGEIEPGVTVAWPAGSPILLIAKAGGFGPVDLFSRIRERVAR